jgi:hypothetical protein
MSASVKLKQLEGKLSNCRKLESLFFSDLNRNSVCHGKLPVKLGQLALTSRKIIIFNRIPVWGVPPTHSVCGLTQRGSGHAHACDGWSDPFFQSSTQEVQS